MGIFGFIGSALGSIFGGKKSQTSSSKINFQDELRRQREEFNRQIERQAQLHAQAQAKQRQTIFMILGIGALAVVGFMFFKK